MAISPNKAHMSIEFIYETAEEEPAMWVKFHNTEMGETISISDNREEWFDLPASFFSETVDYLRSEHGLLGGKKLVRKSTGSLGGVPAPKISLALPKIVKKSESPLVQPEPEPEPEPESAPPVIPLADVKPVQSLTALAAGKFEETNIPKRQVIRGADEETAAAMRGGHNEDKAIQRTG